jgi:photosystem II stability/assembly factor-like uncharacterized protein
MISRLMLMVCALILGTTVGPLARLPAAAQETPCWFTLGFAVLRDMIGAGTVGECLENEWFNPANGNAEQRTSGGLLVWRKADNWTAFTDGYWTWINGPYGLAQRLNMERFDWEAEPAAADWELTGLTEAAIRLFTPWSGALFAQTREGLHRSDDAGTTWRAVTLPPATDATTLRQGIAVDPNNHMVVYVAGRAGVYRSVDDAATWNLVLPAANQFTPPLAVAVSPADGRLVYVAMNDGTFHSSGDGGQTWQAQPPGPQGGPCTWAVYLLQPHPTDTQRLFRTFGCYAGRDLVGGIPVSQSRDGGQTWASFYARPAAFPGRLAGGQGMSPLRWYLTMTVPFSPGGGIVLRSDDDGATWTELLTLQPEPTAPSGSAAVFGGLAYDPANPDRVWVGRSGTQQGVLYSEDGGAKWQDFGRQDVGRVSDLALGIDGLNLFAATEQGVWRMRLG